MAEKEPRDCCGCSCGICEDGHLMGFDRWREHSAGCIARYWRQAEADIRALSHGR